MGDWTKTLEFGRRPLGPALEEERARRQLRASMFGPPDDRPHARDERLRIGRYELGFRLGMGGLGVVFAADDPQLGRTVALKLVRARGEIERRDADRRLIDEARAIARVEHDNVIKVFDAGRYSLDGTASAEVPPHGVYVAMERIHGCNLAEWIERDRPSRLALLDAFAAAGRGLAAAHRAGLVHRDFKPSNVMRGDDGRIVVLDFGLAVPEVEPSTEASVPTTGDVPTHPDPQVSFAPWPSDIVIGTPRYMAPEQYERHSVDARCDQYAFCVSLFEAWFGRPPFPSAELAVQHHLKATTRIVWPDSGAPRALIDALRRGLQGDPARRFPSMDVLLRELERARPRSLGASSGWAAALLGVTAVSGSLATLGTGAPDACEEAVEQGRSPWSAATRQTVRERFAASDAPYADEGWAALDQAMTGYVERWTTARAEVCTSPPADERRRCLDRALRGLETVRAVLLDPTSDVVRRGAGLGDGLPDPQRCLDLSSTTASETVPSALDTLWSARMAAAEVMFASGDPMVAHQLASSVRIEARELDATDHVIDGLLVEASCEVAFGRLPQAARAAEEATFLAMQQRRADAVVEGAAELIQYAASDGRLADARAWTARVDSFVDPSSIDDGAIALARARAALALAEERPREATMHARRALEMATRRSGARRITGAQQTLARALRASGELAEAEHYARAALDRTRARYGEDHPAEVDLRVELGDLLEVRGQWEDAEREFLAAQRVCRREFDPRHFCRALTSHRLGEIRVFLGDPRAIADLHEALEAATTALGPTHPLTGVIGTVLTRARIDRDELSEASEHADAAFEVFVDQLGPDHHNTWVARLDLAEIAVRRGDVQRAMRLLGDREPSVAVLVAWARVLQASAEILAGRPAAAASLCDIAWGASDPRVPEIRARVAWWCGAVLESTGRTELARRRIRRVLAEPGRLSATLDARLRSMALALESGRPLAVPWD